MTQVLELRFTASARAGEVSGILLRPDEARCLLVFGHGAGAGMRHAFMEACAQRLAQRRVATLRYQFPSMEKGIRRPDPEPVRLATVRSAVDAATRHAGGLELLAGGKSMGGRMTSMAAAAEPLPGVRGVVFFGFPLHQPGRPDSRRGSHLSRVTVPMLFLQGTRDRLADLDHLRPVCERLRPRATLHIVEGADHSFHVPKRSGRSEEDVLEELAETVSAWALSPEGVCSGG
jgi:hypothetical protein